MHFYLNDNLKQRGHLLFHFPSVSTTFEEAAKLLNSVKTHQWLWVIADEQLKGRGRAGRSWVSPSGNLYLTLAAQIELETRRAPQLSIVAGLALDDCIRNLQLKPGIHPNIRLKWPNDLLIDNAKCAGILCQSTHHGGSNLTTIMLGIGVNVVSYPKLENYSTTCLSGYYQDVTPASLFSVLQKVVTHRIEEWLEHDDLDYLAKDWLLRAGGPDFPVQLNMADHTILHGQLSGLGHDGSLLLKKQNGDIVPVHTGELAH